MTAALTAVAFAVGGLLDALPAAVIAATAGVGGVASRLRPWPDSRASPGATGRWFETLDSDLAELAFEVDTRGVVRAVSLTSRTLLGYEPGQMIGRWLQDFVRRPVPYLDAEVPALPGPWEARWDRADGSVAVLCTDLRPLHRVDGSLAGVRGVVRAPDAEAERIGSDARGRARLGATLEHAPDAMLLVTPEGEELLANEALRTLLGYSREAMERLTLRDLVHPAQLDEVMALIVARTWSDSGPSQYEVQLRNARGEALPVEMALSPVREAGQSTGVLAEVRDLSEARRASDTIRRLSEYDRLTGLPNRDLFGRHVERAVIDARHGGRPAAVLMVDLDRFKVINDTLGHTSGDRLLVAVAERIRAHLLPQHILARFGGDEFLVLAPDLGGQVGAEVVARRVLTAFREPFEHEGHQIKMSASVGIAVSGVSLADADELVRVADAALHHAKARGRDRYVVGSADAADPARRRLQLEHDLRLAMERGELEVHYQPQVDGADGRMRGIEALVRWRHPERGYVPPDEFVPLLEETGLIVAAGEWVLRTACAQVADWHRRGVTGARIAVNLSPRQLLVPDLAAIVRSVLADTGLAPEALELELTETAVMLDMEAAVGALRALHEQGVTIAIDDFGVGQSWLMRLREFPVRTLKVDRSFVTGVADSADGLALVGAIVALGHALGLEVVAEGVETQQELEAVRSVGCDFIQGYYYAPALSAAALERLLARGDRLTAIAS
ncbi:MAG: EAL domain-containing protein [Dehalococcoidia bacterium]